jgi:predicted metalloprotease
MGQFVSAVLGSTEAQWNGACDIGSKTCRFSQAYVIAHEIGRHVQNLLCILPKVQNAQRAMDTVERNHLQVRVELQADCLAGVWARWIWRRLP